MKSKSASHWSVRGGNLGTFSPTPYPHEKLFQQTLIMAVILKNVNWRQFSLLNDW
ncbi:MAG: hypothetical protein GPJ15_07005 [Microcystis aeruginosa G11-06]|nr:hypothetical protein [Microcystis aeruginosa G11-06]